MNPNLPTLNEALNNAFPASLPSNALRARVADLPVKARSRSRKFRLVLTYAATALVIGGVAFIAPRADAIQSLSRIANAVQSARTWHMVTYRPDLNMKLAKSSETWCLDGIVREEAERGRVVRLITPKETVQYRLGEPQALRLPSRNTASQIKTLSSFVKDLQMSVYIRHVEVSRVSVEGHQATMLSAESKNEPVRLRLYADKENNFPFLATVESRSGSGWRLAQRITIDGNPFPRNKVELNLAKGVPILDFKAAREEWAKRLSSGKKQYTGKFAPVGVDDVWVNGQGDVFVLYTNGQINGEGAGSFDQIQLMEVTDNKGTHYLKDENSLMGTILYTDKRPPEGLVIDGQDVHAVVFVPETPVSGPCRLKLTFGTDEFVVPKNFKPKGNSVSMNEMVRVPRHRVTHEVSLENGSERLPAWMPFLGMSLNEYGLASSENYARAKFAIDTGDGKKAEPFAREYLRITQVRAVEEGNSYAMYGMYEMLGDALALQHRNEEARQWLQKALDERPGEFYEGVIREKLTKIPAP